MKWRIGWLLVALPACGQNTTGPNTSLHAGRYILRSVNGVPVPAPIAGDSGAVTEVESGDAHVFLADVFDLSLVLRATPTAPPAVPTTRINRYQGTWSLVNLAYRFAVPDSGIDALASFTDTQMALRIGANSYVFVQQCGTSC